MIALLNKPTPAIGDTTAQARLATATPSRINDIIASIEDNARNICNLVKEKSKSAEKISANLDFFRLTRQCLSCEQITSFASFSKISTKDSHMLKATLREIAALRSLSTIKKELLHTHTDLDLVYNELQIIFDLQCDALSYLEEILNSSDQLLKLLAH